MKTFLKGICYLVSNGKPDNIDAEAYLLDKNLKIDGLIYGTLITPRDRKQYQVVMNLVPPPENYQPNMCTLGKDLKHKGHDCSFDCSISEFPLFYRLDVYDQDIAVYELSHVIRVEGTGDLLRFISNTDSKLIFETDIIKVNKEAQDQIERIYGQGLSREDQVLCLGEMTLYEE